MDNLKNTGLVYIFTGNGKGKTSAALGVAMRAVGQGKRVAMVQWYKESSKFPARRCYASSVAGGKVQSSKLRKIPVRKPGWTIGEHELPELLKKPLFEIYPMGQGFYQLPTDHATPAEHKRAAQQSLKLAKKLLKQTKVNRLEGYKVKKNNKSVFNLSTFQPSSLFLLILDEVLNAVNDKLIELNQLIELISSRGQTHIILTGRNVPKKLIALADLVTEMKNIKHPFEKGKKAVMGLDF